MKFTVVTCAAGVVLCAAVAYAQERTPSITAAVIASHHERGKSDSVYVCCGFSGTTPGAVIGVHLPIGASGRVVAEGSLQSSIESRQSGRALRGGEVMTAHRDTIVSALRGFGPRTPGKVTPIWVAGASLVFRHTERRPVPGRSNFVPYSLDDLI